MSEDNISDTQKLEMQYAELLKKKTDFMANEVAAYEEQASKTAKATKAKEDEDAKEAQYIAFKERLYKENPKMEPTPSLDPMANSGSPMKTTNPKMMAYRQYHDDFLKAHGTDPVSMYNYGSDAHIAYLDGHEAYAFTGSDDGCVDAMDSWSPADYYCSMMWHGVQNYGQLAGKVTVRGCDINAGNGGVVQIRNVSATHGVQTLTLSQGCSCLDCSGTTVSTYTATIDIHGIYRVICDIDEFRVGGMYKPAVIESMARDIANGKDREIWSQLIGAPTPGQTVTLPADLACSGTIVGSCCSMAANLYQSIIRMEALMREAGYFKSAEPTLIMSPTVAAVLKYKEGTSSPQWYDSSFSVTNGLLTKIGSINVIEYGDGPTCADSTQTIAVMIDPSRAVSEFYGKRPQFKEDEDPIECLSTKLVAVEYVAIDDLDQGAIGHIINP